MKKYFFFITTLLLCSLLVVPISAADNGSLSMESASGNQGDTITLNLNLNSNPGLVTMTIRVSYDKSVLQLTNVTESGLIDGTHLNTNYGSPYTISWIDGAATTNNTKTGTIATLTFKILDNAEFGDSTVNLQFVDSYDTDYNKNSFSASSGKVTVTCNHSYSEWSDDGNDQHSRTCSTCSVKENSSHTWNSGSVTKEPTCKDEGEKTFICTDCKATKTESISKKTTHNYKTFWSTDNTNHWHECTVCKDKKDVATHTPGAEATETTAQTCTTCNYIIKASLENNHDHDFENECDKDCSICGYTRETEHKFSETWTADANTHWHVCSTCGLKNDEAAHEPGAEATETIIVQVCTVCNYEIVPAFGREETTESTDESVDVTAPVVPTEENDSDGGNFQWWIVVAISVAVVSGVVVVVVMKRKREKYNCA